MPRIYVHGATGIRCSTADRRNNNQVTLEIAGAEGRSELELTLFGLPDPLFDRLVLAFGDDSTSLCLTRAPEPPAEDDNWAPPF